MASARLPRALLVTAGACNVYLLSLLIGGQTQGSTTSGSTLALVTPLPLLAACGAIAFAVRRVTQLVSFDARMHDRAVERLQLESALRSAIERGELTVYYQPIVDLNTRAVRGFEALARWRHPKLGYVAPTRFIPLAEETGMIAEIGAWVLTEAATQASRLQQLFPKLAPLSMHVNMSVRQMQQDPSLLDRVDQALALSQLAPELLTIEITESVIMEESEKGERCSTPCAAAASACVWTTSGPATRRSATCTASASTASRSTSRSCAT